MGQKTNPIGNRLGIIRGWESNWFGGKDMALKVVEDERIRQYLQARIEKGGIARVTIERTLKRVTVTIHTSRPGIIIGRQGKEVDRIREELKKLTGKEVQINIAEIRKPELDAVLVGESVAKQIETRVNYRRAIKAAIKSTIDKGADGIKIRIGGRLAGADIARSEEYKEGKTPLHTFRSDIDYANVEAQTVYGKLGIKVWICKGEVFGKRDLSPTASEDQKGATPRNLNDRRDDRGRDGDGGGGNDRRNNDRGGNRGGGAGGNNNRGGGGAGGNSNNRSGGGGQGGSNNNRGGGGGQGGSNNNRGGGGGGKR